MDFLSALFEFGGDALSQGGEGLMGGGGGNDMGGVNINGMKGNNINGMGGGSNSMLGGNSSGILGGFTKGDAKAERGTGGQQFWEGMMEGEASKTPNEAMSMGMGGDTPRRAHTGDRISGLMSMMPTIQRQQRQRTNNQNMNPYLMSLLGG